MPLLVEFLLADAAAGRPPACGAAAAVTPGTKPEGLIP